MKTIKRLLTGTLLILSFAAFPLFPADSVSAQSTDACLQGGSIEDCAKAGVRQTDPAGSSTDVGEVVQLIVNILSWIVGVVAVIMIIIGGLKYVTSGGDAGNVSSAKNTILYAIIGLVVVLLAQIIVRFVVDQVT
jgi:hypothetical protein